MLINSSCIGLRYLHPNRRLKPTENLSSVIRLSTGNPLIPCVDSVPRIFL